MLGISPGCSMIGNGTNITQFLVLIINFCFCWHNWFATIRPPACLVRSGVLCSWVLVTTLPHVASITFNLMKPIVWKSQFCNRGCLPCCSQQDDMHYSYLKTLVKLVCHEKLTYPECLSSKSGMVFSPEYSSISKPIGLHDFNIADLQSAGC